MSTFHQLIEGKIDSIRDLCHAHRVVRLDAFGSVLREDFGLQSDVDFLVLFERGEGIDAFQQYFDLKEGLERLLNRPVDLVCANAIRNPYFKKEVERSRQLVYAHRLAKVVQDALEACRELQEFPFGKSYPEVVEDRGLQLIIERLFEVLGEALYRIRNLNESAFNQLTDGHRIIGTRNLLAHGYDIVDHEILWAAIQSNIDTLVTELGGLLESAV